MVMSKLALEILRGDIKDEHLMQAIEKMEQAEEDAATRLEQVSKRATELAAREKQLDLSIAGVMEKGEDISRTEAIQLERNLGEWDTVRTELKQAMEKKGAYEQVISISSRAKGAFERAQSGASNRNTKKFRQLLYFTLSKGKK